jgi:hypothetical protein
MIGHWPVLYPDETIYSGYARYMERMGFPSHRAARINLLGSPRSSGLADFPSRLGLIIDQIPREFGVNAEELIGKHTILPFFRPFFGASLVSKIAEQMLHIVSENYSLRLRGASTQPAFLRYCPGCAEEDRRRYGEAYWHRLHQLGVVHICPTHLVLLIDSSIHRAWTANYYFVGAEQAIPTSAKVTTVDPKQPDAQLLLWLAEQSQWLLNEPHLDSEQGDIAARYRFQLSLSRFASRHGKVTTGRISEELALSLPAFSLPSHGLDNIPTLTPMYKLVTKGIGQPSLHLLLIWMLGLSVKDFLTSKYSPAAVCEYFEPGPWPCLNPVCDFSSVDVIQGYAKVTRRSGQLAGVFSCTCGYTYSRRGPDLEGSSRYFPDKVVTRGAVWETELVEQWHSNKKLSEIASSLGGTKAVVRRVAERIGLSLQRPFSKISLQPLTHLRHKVTRSEYLHKYRNELLEQLEKNPTYSRQMLRRDLRKRTLKWLGKYDRDWLLSVLPPARSGFVSSSSVDWETRDLDLAARIPSIRERLLGVQGSPVRVTKQRIVRALGVQASSINEVRFPKTVAVLQTSTESLQECAIRRLQWIVSRAEAEVSGKGVCFSVLLRHARIRTEWLGDSAIIDAIADAATKISIERLPSDIFDRQEFRSYRQDEAA